MHHEECIPFDPLFDVSSLDFQVRGKVTCMVILSFSRHYVVEIVADIVDSLFSYEEFTVHLGHFIPILLCSQLNIMGSLLI